MPLSHLTSVPCCCQNIWPLYRCHWEELVSVNQSPCKQVVWTKQHIISWHLYWNKLTAYQPLACLIGSLFFFISLDLLVLLYSSRSQQNVQMNNWRAQSVTTLPCVMKVTPLWNNAILNTGSVAACSPRPSGRLGDLNSLIVVDVLLFVFTEAARASGHTCQLTSNRVAGPGFFFKHHLWFPSVNDG